MGWLVARRDFLDPVAQKGTEVINVDEISGSNDAWEDPVTFGSGHFVLYPEAGSMTRFAVEEQYTGTDWSDDDRMATSWTWDSQARVRQADGSYPWESLAHGEVKAGDYRQLLDLAEEWAKTTHDRAEWEQALTVDAITTTAVDRAGGPRTLLS